MMIQPMVMSTPARSNFDIQPMLVIFRYNRPTASITMPIATNVALDINHRTCRVPNNGRCNSQRRVHVFEFESQAKNTKRSRPARLLQRRPTTGR